MGYGITNNFDFFGIDGTYNIEEDKTISGTYEIYDFYNPESVLGNGNISGNVDGTGTKITLTLDGLSLNLKGTLFIEDPYEPQYPDIPKDWTLHIAGGGYFFFKIEHSSFFPPQGYSS